MRKEIKILLVEDNDGDVVKDGEKALQYLNKENEFANAETPDLILLDINLPKIDGKEVLARIKKDDVLKVIPVVMLTTSDSERDIRDSYQSHANCYITKPVDFQKFMDVVQTVKNFWINIVQLPTPNE